jgi:serine/threonine protein kinase
VWAVGVICYTMICGYPPFWSENMADMLHMIKHGDYNFDGPSWESVSDETKSFVSFLLTRDPAKRPTSDECLQHPFLNSTTLKEDKLENSTLRHYIDSRRTGKIFRVVRVITRMERASRGDEPLLLVVDLRAGGGTGWERNQMLVYWGG